MCFLLPGDKDGGRAGRPLGLLGAGEGLWEKERGACLPMTNCDYYTLTPGGLGVQSRDAVGRMFLAASNQACGEMASEEVCVCVCVGSGSGRGGSRRRGG